MSYKSYRFMVNEEAEDMSYLNSKLSAMTSDARNDLIRKLLLEYFRSEDESGKEERYRSCG